jgi:hypothetical protein
MILLLLKDRGMVSGLFEKKRDAIPPHPAPSQALHLRNIKHRPTSEGNNIHVLNVHPKDYVTLHYSKNIMELLL